jgi:hypothetical protein
MGTRVAMEMTLDISAIRHRLALDGEESICTSCEEIKPMTEFYKNSASTTGLGYYCKPCQDEYVERSRRRKRENEAKTQAIRIRNSRILNRRR